MLISRVVSTTNPSIRVGDAILSINQENISHWTHQRVMTALRDAPTKRVQLTVRYLKEIADYLSITSAKCRSSLPVTLVNLLPGEGLRRSSQNFFPVVDAREIRRANGDSSIVGRYPLLYAYVSEQITDNEQTTFRVHPLHGPPTGLLISASPIQQQTWISRLNMVIRHLIHRRLTELNQTYLSHEQILYASWIHQSRTWKSLFLVFKDNLLYLFDSHRPFSLSADDFLSCPRVHPILEISVQSIRTDRYGVILTLLHPSSSECRPVDFQRRSDYDEFLSNYQRALYLAVYSVRFCSFDCLHQGEVCRLVISIKQGLQLYHPETKHLLWMFTLEELQSRSDNGRETLVFRFRRPTRMVDVQVQCYQMKKLLHVLDSFLIVKSLGQNVLPLD